MMRSIALTAILIVSTNLCLAADPLAQEYGELVFVSLIYRHGDRAITQSSYPKDPYKNASYWPMGYGQLTNQGKERHYEFGKWLRNRYSEFLPVIYSNNDVYIRSTSIDRAIMSAAANLAGLYPPSKVQQWNDNLGKLWQPIPIHSTPKNLETLLSFGDNCPQFVKEFTNLKTLPEVIQFNNDHQDLYNYIREHSGLKLNDSLYDTAMLHDILLVETQFNYTLPNWTKTIFPDKLEKVAEFGFVLPSYTQNLKKLTSGVLLNEIVTHMKLKQNSTMKPDVKLWIYSGHDSNVAALLNSLNVYNNKLPPYASSVIFELRKKKNDNSSLVVTVSYKNTSLHEPYLLHVPGCSSVACDLEQFISVLKPILLTDWYKECHKTNDINWLIYFGFIVILFLAISIIYFMFYKQYFICYCGRNYQKLYHAVPREEIETMPGLDQDGRSRVAVSFRMDGVESSSADV